MCRLILLFSFLNSFVALAEVTQVKPYFETGLAGGMGYIPDYPAAGQSRLHWLAFPVFFLRGEVIRSDDEDGTRARFLRNMRVTFDLSFAGSFPTAAEKNEARRGMPDLDWMGEVGPRMHFRLFGNDAHFVRFSVAERVIFSTNFKRGDYRGMVFSPAISARHENLIFNRISVSARVSPQFATRELNEYFYTVEPEYATSVRPEYHARAGYVGTNVFSTFAYERGSHGVFAGLGASFHDGAANAQSPVFKERVNMMVFAAFRWFFYSSEREGYP
jgi:outer membrane protein